MADVTYRTDDGTYDTVYIDSSGTETKTNKAMKNVKTKTNALSKYDKKLKEIQLQAAYKAYRFDQESKGLNVRTYWEWVEDKAEARRERARKRQEFWLDTPKGTLSVIGGCVVIVLAGCAHAFHWLHIP